VSSDLNDRHLLARGPSPLTRRCIAVIALAACASACIRQSTEHALCRPLQSSTTGGRLDAVCWVEETVQPGSLFSPTMLGDQSVMTLSDLLRTVRLDTQSDGRLAGLLDRERSRLEIACDRLKGQGCRCEVVIAPKSQRLDDVVVKDVSDVILDLDKQSEGKADFGLDLSWLNGGTGRIVTITVRQRVIASIRWADVVPQCE
jgi:hypothetical protein